MNKKSGFTLIELLVVIAILAIMVSILIPAALKGIEMANRSKCANNLKSLGVAFSSYASDNQGEFPHCNPLPSASGTFTEVSQFTKIVTNVCARGYVEDLHLWVCPSDKVDYSKKAISVAAADSISNNTFNSIGNCSYMYISGYHLLRTSETPAVAPVLCDESNARELGNLTPGKMPKIDKDDNHGANIRNVLFLDGHVTTFKDADASNAIFDNLKNPQVICSVD